MLRELDSVLQQLIEICLDIFHHQANLAEVIQLKIVLSARGLVALETQRF